MGLAEAIVSFLGAYAAAGLLFASVFVTLGVSRMDATARGSRWPFRLIILPGAAALWPLLLLRWLREGGRRS